MAQFNPTWTFDGDDPSADMLAQAEEAIAPHASRIRLHHGYIDTAPDGPYHAATCLLTFHFIPIEQRLATLRHIRNRLRPGAPFVLAHISVPEHEPDRSTWLRRHAAFGAPDDTDAETLTQRTAALSTRLSLLSPEREEAMLAEAGFTATALFYAGFALKGWVAYA